jgi:hypothetical protein
MQPLPATVQPLPEAVPPLQAEPEAAEGSWPSWPTQFHVSVDEATLALAGRLKAGPRVGLSPASVMSV